jgi:DNA-binding NarL/FixJ family response regulator
MAQLAALIVTQDEDFRRRATHLLRAGGVPIGIMEERRADGPGPDIGVVDIRSDGASGLATIERLRAGQPAMAIFAAAAEAHPDLILQAMRAGANEFFAWAPSESQAGRTMEESFHGAVRRRTPDRASHVSRTCSSAPRAGPGRRPSRSTARSSWPGSRNARRLFSI